jgi:hypothetical protein
MSELSKPCSDQLCVRSSYCMVGRRQCGTGGCAGTGGHSSRTDVFYSWLQF